MTDQRNPTRPLTCFSCRHLLGDQCDIRCPAINTSAYGIGCPEMDYEPGAGPAEFDSYQEYLEARP